MTFRINNQRFQDFLQKVNDYSKQPDRLTKIQFLVIRIAFDIFTICIFEAILKYNISHPKKSETQKTTDTTTEVGIKNLNNNVAVLEQPKKEESKATTTQNQAAKAEIGEQSTTTSEVKKEIPTVVANKQEESAEAPKPTEEKYPKAHDEFFASGLSDQVSHEKKPNPQEVKNEDIKLVETTSMHTKKDSDKASVWADQIAVPKETETNEPKTKPADTDTAPVVKTKKKVSKKEKSTPIKETPQVVQHFKPAPARIISPEAITALVATSTTHMSPSIKRAPHIPSNTQATLIKEPKPTTNFEKVKQEISWADIVKQPPIKQAIPIAQSKKELKSAELKHEESSTRKSAINTAQTKPTETNAVQVKSLVPEKPIEEKSVETEITAFKIAETKKEVPTKATASVAEQTKAANPKNEVPIEEPKVLVKDTTHPIVDPKKEGIKDDSSKIEVAAPFITPKVNTLVATPTIPMALSIEREPYIPSITISNEEPRKEPKPAELKYEESSDQKNKSAIKTTPHSNSTGTNEVEVHSLTPKTAFMAVECKETSKKIETPNEIPLEFAAISQGLTQKTAKFDIQSIKEMDIFRTIKLNPDEFIKDIIENLLDDSITNQYRTIENKTRDSVFYKRKFMRYWDDASKDWRHTNIRPYSDTLMLAPNDSKNILYLNGNIIEMPHAPLLYAYQAPNLSNFSGYFEYLKKTPVKHVVVLGPDENNRKYDPYFPLEHRPFDYEKYGLTCDSSTKITDENFMQHNLSYNSSSEKLKITVYRDWADGDVVESQKLLALVKHVAEVSKLQSIGVHCSAGVGRTGVFLAVYYAYLLHLQGIQGELNYAQIVACLRLFRANLVQSSEQLKLVKDTIALFVQKTVS